MIVLEDDFKERLNKVLEISDIALIILDADGIESFSLEDATEISIKQSRELINEIFQEISL